jgi:hypothetical protein
MTENPKNHEHWNGPKNRCIRYWFYLCKGNEIVNQFHSLIISLLGIFFVFKLSSPWLFALMLIVIIPLLIISGWFSVHHLSTVIDWLGIKFGTYGSNRNLELLEDISKTLKEKSDTNIPKISNQDPCSLYGMSCNHKLM